MSPVNCRGNMPRDHLYVGRVDERSLGLMKNSVFLIDRRQPGEPDVQLACMLSAHEDRENRQLVVHVPRYVQQAPDRWGGDSYEYRVSAE